MKKADGPSAGDAAVTTERPIAEPARPPFPLAVLLVTLAVQTLSTAAAYSIPAVAPEVARHLNVPSAWIGFFISTVYGVGVLSALFSPRVIHEHGAVRVNQAVLVATLTMLVVAAAGSITAVAIAAALMGLAYGATAPASTHLLVPLTPPAVINVVLSLRQIGVPLGGVLAGLLMAPMTLAWGWQAALLAEAIPALILLALLERVRRRWDRRHTPSAIARRPASPRLEPIGLLAGNVALRRLTLTVFVYSGLQLCFIVFITTQLTTIVGLDLVTADWMLAAYQVSGVISRPLWGWLADRLLAARWLLVLHGIMMCSAAVAAGQFAAGSSTAAVLLVAVTGGSSASGYTGIAYAEFARLGGPKRTEATGLGAASMFAGVLFLPSLMSLAVLQFGGYEAAYTSIGFMALAGGILLALPARAPG